MISKAFHVTAAIGLTLAATAPADASRLRLPPARTPAGSIYSPAAIAGELAKRGYRIEKMKRKGTAYSVTATGPHGNRVQMLVDGRSGDIIGLSVVQAAANFIGAVAAAMKSGKNTRYYDDTRPFGVVVPDRYQVNWTSITNNNFAPKRGSPRYVSAPSSGRGYRYAVPYRTVRPAVGGGTRSTYSPKQMSRPLYDVYESSGARLETVETREDTTILSQVSVEETRFSSQEESFESSYEESYFGSDIDEASIEQTGDYDAEDGDEIFADNPADNYEAEVETGDFNDYAATVEDEEEYADEGVGVPDDVDDPGDDQGGGEVDEPDDKQGGDEADDPDGQGGDDVDDPGDAGGDDPELTLTSFAAAG